MSNTTRGCVGWAATAAIILIALLGMVAAALLGRWEYVPAYAFFAYFAYLLATGAAGLPRRPEVEDGSIVAAAVAGLVFSVVSEASPFVLAATTGVGAFGAYRLVRRGSR